MNEIQIEGIGTVVLPTEDMTLKNLGDYCQEVERRTALDAWLFGKTFIIARKKARHGEWGPWCKKYVPRMSQDTIDRYRRLAANCTDPTQLVNMAITMGYEEFGIPIKKKGKKPADDKKNGKKPADDNKKKGKKPADNNKADEDDDLMNEDDDDLMKEDDDDDDDGIGGEGGEEEDEDDLQDEDDEEQEEDHQDQDDGIEGEGDDRIGELVDQCLIEMRRLEPFLKTQGIKHHKKLKKLLKEIVYASASLD